MESHGAMSQLSVIVESMRYPDALGSDLIADVDLTFSPSTVTALLGPSGAGKTTFLRIIAGLETRYRGRVLLNGERISRPTPKTQLVFQDYRIIPWKTVMDNLLLALKSSRRPAAEARQLASHWLATIGLHDRATSWPKTLSGGELARLALARALIGSPTVLLLDEPFRNLDLKVKYALQRMMSEHLAGNHQIVILVSHSPEDALLLSDRVLLFERNPMRQPVGIEVKLQRPRQPGNRLLIDEVARLSAVLSGQTSPRDLA